MCRRRKCGRWTDYLGDPPLVMALLDRVVDSANVQKVRGDFVSQAPSRAESEASLNGLPCPNRFALTVIEHAERRLPLAAATSEHPRHPSTDALACIGAARRPASRPLSVLQAHVPRQPILLALLQRSLRPQHLSLLPLPPSRQCARPLGRLPATPSPRRRPSAPQLRHVHGAPVHRPSNLGASRSQPVALRGQALCQRETQRQGRDTARIPGQRRPGGSRPVHPGRPRQQTGTAILFPVWSPTAAPNR